MLSFGVVIYVINLWNDDMSFLKVILCSYQNQNKVETCIRWLKFLTKFDIQEPWSIGEMMRHVLIILWSPTSIEYTKSKHNFNSHKRSTTIQNVIELQLAQNVYKYWISK
jgi:hypothetical protein